LEASFAQFQADQAVVGLAKQIKRNEAGFAELMSRAICDLGNFGEYAEIKEEIRNLEKESARANKGARSKAIQRIEELRNQLRHHPCHSCPDREPHSRLAERAYRLHRETLSLKERVNNRTNVIARRFDLVQIVLGQLGYLQDEELTPAGRLLSKVYSESDLLVAETLKSGALAQLSPAELAAVVSSLVFEARKDQSAKIPNANIEEALTEIIACWSKISRIEEELHLDGIRPPDFGFVNATYRWARGNSLTSILRGTELSVGDFIRSMKQVIDLLRQIAALDEGISAGARSALKQIDRGIVTFAGVVG
jgi:ATP-dependent RNA helicase HelY